jgi:hypothetical protein
MDLCSREVLKAGTIGVEIMSYMSWAALVIVFLFGYSVGCFADALDYAFNFCL